MKSVIVGFIAAAAIVGFTASPAHAQLPPLGTCSTCASNTVNCTCLTACFTNDAKTYGLNNQYVASETVTWSVQCKNTNNGTATNMGNNAVTATGQGGWDNGFPAQFHACNPIFGYTISNPNSTSANNYFLNVGQDNLYIPPGEGGPECLPTNYHTSQTSCASTACNPPSGGGGSGNCCQCSGPPINSARNFKGGVFRKVQGGGSQNNCCACSPIVIDVSGNGFVLTNAVNGVKFDISGTGQPIQMAWTAPDIQNAFLCLPDAKGACDDGADLFGSFTPQPPSSTPNGFAALAVYDQPANGGNGDGIIDTRDGIFSSLRLWIDANHDGNSQPNEIFTLPQLGITSISLNYKSDQRQDQYGNIFRYRSQVGSTSGAGRMAYDVFFVTGGMTTACTPPGIVRGKDGLLQ